MTYPQGKLRATTVVEQNPNTLAGVQVDTAVYIGTGATCPVVRVGREAPIYILEGVQTAVAVAVVADTVNAAHGDKITVRIGTGASTTSVISIVNSTFAGVTVATITSGVGREATVTFDGNAKVWR